jgi:hypothetical protein
VATAQLDAWIGVRKGSVDAVTRVVDATLADAALARMMLYRRRAVVARVVSHFFAGMGGRFPPYLEARIPHAPVDCAGELATAKAAGDMVDDVCGAPPPLLFERALLAEASGQLEDAGADLDRLLESYPGFVAAAVAAARVASAAGDPGRAIRSLAVVEGEVAQTREGAALLADAARALGLHEAASRYDLAALVSRGAYDSCGNDCAPVDVTGKIASDNRMPQIFYFEGQPDGSFVCNARGVYYRVSPMLRWALLLFGRGRPVSTFRNLNGGGAQSATATKRQSFGAMTARLRLFLNRPTSFARTLRRLGALSANVWRRLRGLGLAIVGALGGFLHRIDAALLRLLTGLFVAATIFLYRAYRLLPSPVRAPANRCLVILLDRIQSRARHWARFLLPYAKRGLIPITERDAALQMARLRYRSGIARIFGLATPANEGASRAGVVPPHLPSPYAGDAPSNLGGLHMPAPGKLPPLAAQVLSRLAGEVNLGGGPPRS